MHPALRASHLSDIEEAPVDNDHALPQPPGISEVAHRLREDVGMLVSAIDRERGALEDRVRGLVEEHPVATMAGAFGIGYVLGGGIFSRRSLPIFGMALRFAAGEMLGRLMSQMDDGNVAIPR
jgi:hypothetical protein